MKDQEKTIYTVTVYNKNGVKNYRTYNEDVTMNYAYGNTPTAMFDTVDGILVSLPPTQVIIEQEKEKK